MSKIDWTLWVLVVVQFVVFVIGYSTGDDVRGLLFKFVCLLTSMFCALYVAIKDVD